MANEREKLRHEIATLGTDLVHLVSRSGELKDIQIAALRMWVRELNGQVVRIAEVSGIELPRLEEKSGNDDGSAGDRERGVGRDEEGRD